VLPVNFSVTGRIRGRTSPNLLREALSAARRRHPLLAARIADPGPWQAWLTTEGVPDPELRVIRTTDPDGWHRTVEQELTRPFDTGTGPLSRFVMVDAGDSFDLVGTYHHLVADGLSACFVLRDVLRWLAGPTTDMSPVLAAPADDLLPGRRANPADLRTVARMLRGKGRAPRPGGQLSYATWSLDTDETSGLLTRCRAEGATAQAAFCTAFARALADLGHLSPACIAVPADLRWRLAPSPGEAVGLYATSFLMLVDGTGSYDFWAAARRARTDIHDRLRSEELVPLVRVYRLLSFLPRKAVSSFLRRSETKQTLFDVSISNASTARMSIPTHYGALRLDGLYGAAHTSLSGTPLVFGTGFDGRLFFSVTSTDGPHAAELCARAMSHLKDAVSDSRHPYAPSVER
jgi:hypothetical protein